MHKLLLLELGLAALPLICVLAYYPAGPTVPPSKAAAASQSQRLVNRDMGLAGLLTPSFIFIVLAGGMNMGVYGLWSGVLTEVLPAHWSDTQKGMFGLVNTIMSVAGGLAGGIITDLPPLRRRLKSVAVCSMFLATILFGIFAMSVPGVQNNGTWTNGSGSHHPSSSLNLNVIHIDSRATLMAICAAAGFVRGIADPLFFEISADVAYPAPAGTAGSILTFFYHVMLVISLSVPATFLNKWALLGTAMVMCCCFVLTSLTTVKYHRIEKAN
jgi:hypothetical protein